VKTVKIAQNGGRPSAHMSRAKNNNRRLSIQQMGVAASATVSAN